MKSDKERFSEAKERVLTGHFLQDGGIGTLGEKTLHAVLKNYFQPDGDSQEVKLGSYYADIVSEDGVIEIQTANLGRLRDKLREFLAVTRVTVVYPVAQEKYICWVDPETGEADKKNKSPKKGGLHDAFWELYKIKSFLGHENFSLCIVMLSICEYRYLNGWSKDKKRGSVRCDRLPLELLSEIYFFSKEDYKLFLPQGLPEQFTVEDLRAGWKTTDRNAGTGAAILRELGVIEKVAKRGRAFVYRESP